MYKCFICYETKVAVDEMVFLECLHSLCKCCMNQLHQCVCPFCRNPIDRSKIATKRSPTTVIPVYTPRISVRVRRRRKKTSTNREEIDTDYGPVVLETNRNRPKYKKDNFKKGRWALSRANNMGRYKTR